MNGVVKVLLWVVGGFIAVFTLAAVALYVFFDPNDFREEISASVKKQTGRDLIIDGEISLEVFPWLAVEIGKSSLGNAPGFGDEPMASFERASFSVRLLPVILHQEVVVGTATIESLRLNLAVNRGGVSNWDDLVSSQSDETADASSEATGGLDINSINIVDAAVTYVNGETGERVTLSEFDLEMGRLKDNGADVPIVAALHFDLQPTGVAGAINFDSMIAFDAASGELRLNDVSVSGSLQGIAAIETTMALHTDSIEVAMNESQVSLQPLELAIFDMKIVADVAPFSYKGEMAPRAHVVIETFSPRSVMQLFDVPPPSTADPVALSQLSIEANATLTPAAIELGDITVTLDDTSFTGQLSVPMAATGFYQFDLSGDAIDLTRYMEPASDSQDMPDEGTTAIDIPADLIRPLNVRGKLSLAKATLGNIVLEKLSLGVNSGGGKLRLFPMSAQLFGGTYNGDVRINVSAATPKLSLNEKIVGVDLARFAQAMFEQDNVTGTIDGTFALAGKGADIAAIQRDLSGKLSLELTDGSYVGTDVWYEIRRGRAAFKGEEPPEPQLPAKTDFSTVRLTGVVTDGVVRSDDLFAQLPFMQLTGRGQADLTAATVDYRLSARILERPEFLSDATAEELDEFTEAVIPLKITGPLASPSIKPDFEALLQDRIEDEIRDKFKELFP